MDLVIKINCDNEAFLFGRCENEIATILRGVVEKMRQDDFDIIPLSDSNGNKVGTAEFIKNAEDAKK